jgi:hypothetical protein
MWFVRTGVLPDDISRAAAPESAALRRHDDGMAVNELKGREKRRQPLS